MSNPYYEVMDKMEKQGVQIEYISGWATGYLRHPRREQQHLTPAYEAGYKDGLEKKTDGYNAWVKK